MASAQSIIVCGLIIIKSSPEAEWFLPPVALDLVVCCCNCIATTNIVCSIQSLGYAGIADTKLQ